MVLVLDASAMCNAARMVPTALIVQKPRPIGLARRYCVVDYRLHASQGLRSEGIAKGTTSLNPRSLVFISQIIFLITTRLRLPYHNS
jgi:hypothetical protein